MPTIYVVGDTNDELIAGLHSPRRSERAEAAEAIGLLHVYLALPHLAELAKDDPDATVRTVASTAIAALLPNQQLASTSADGPGLADGRTQGATPLSESAALAIRGFNLYIQGRASGTCQPSEKDLFSPVTAYLNALGGYQLQDLDAIELSGAEAVGSLARFLETPPQHAGAKSMSYRDTALRVDRYKALQATCTESEE